MKGFVVATLVIALAATALGSSSRALAEADLLKVTSRVAYDLRADQGPVRVLWQVTVVDNDPATRRGAVYESLTLPILRGASAVSARSASGQTLAVALDAGQTGPVVGATVEFDTPLSYQVTYSFTLSYELAVAREEWLLITPYYVYLPLLAFGDEARVSVTSLPGPGWTATVEPEDCQKSGGEYVCAGSEGVYVAATAEVVRPDALSSTAFPVALRGKTLNITIRYFQGEEAFADHARELMVAALPVIEDLSGFAYDGPTAVTVSQGGQQATLGNEGVTRCASEGCEIVVSPVGDDYTLIHELAHLWTGIFAKRWLSEGFAQLITEDAVGRLPTGMVRGQAPQWAPSAVALQLDDWEDAGTGIGASEEERLRQIAGYDRSLRFLYLLRYQLGGEILRQVNATIAESGEAADSRRYLDLLEEAGDKNVDDLFARWVFPPSYGSILADRREARDRLAALEVRAAEEGLSPDVPAAIREQVRAWRFGEALTALEEAEAGLQRVEGLRADLLRLRAEAAAAGLRLPEGGDEALQRWDFDGAADFVRSAREALDAYVAAAAKVHGHRSLWQRFGLLGSDPEARLRSAAEAFVLGDFERASDRAQAAAEAMGHAGDVALRRLLIVAGVLAALAVVILMAVWVARLREREFA